MVMEEESVRYVDANLIKIKHAVLEEVARLAFAGELEERKDEIPFKLIPGPTTQFRCCIYKEREIIRQRVRLAEGKAPGPKDDGNVIQVISSACEDCPISSYTVTETVRTVLEKPVSMHVNSALLNRDATAPISMHRNVKSAENVRKPVRTMRSLI